MKKILFITLFFIALLTGIVSGIAYERYLHREECLKIAFDNSGAENLSEAEITEILNVLNSNGAGASQSIPSNESDTSNLNEEPIPEKKTDTESETSDKAQDKKQYVGSKNSTKFYPTGCRYAKLIKEENKIYYVSVAEGEGQGKTYVECK